MQLYTSAWQIILAFCDNLSAARTLSICRASHSAADLVRWAPVECAFPVRGRVTTLKVDWVDHWSENILDYCEELTMDGITKKLPQFKRVHSLTVSAPIEKYKHIRHLDTITSLDVTVVKQFPVDIFPQLKYLKMHGTICIKQGTFPQLITFEGQLDELPTWQNLTELHIYEIPEGTNGDNYPQLTTLSIYAADSKLPNFQKLTTLKVREYAYMEYILHISSLTALTTPCIIGPIPQGALQTLTAIDCYIIENISHIAGCKALTSLTTREFGGELTRDMFPNLKLLELIRYAVKDQERYQDDRTQPISTYREVRDRVIWKTICTNEYSFNLFCGRF